MRKILIMKSNTNKRSYLFLFKLLPLTAMVVLLQACFVAKPYQRPKNVLDDARYRTDQLQGDTSNIASLSWTRQIHDDLTLYTSASYSTANFTGTGTQNSVGLAASLQYLISETLTGTLRYAFYDQRSATPGQNIYQNLLLIGVTKRF